MRNLIAGTLLLALNSTLPLAAETPATKPNTLTPKEIADGWILLFEGETTFGWRIDKGEMKVEDGTLKLGGKQETHVHLDFGFFELSWEWRWEGEKAPSRVVRATKADESPAGSEGEFDQHRKGKKGQWIAEQWRIAADPKVAAASDKKFDTTPDGGMTIQSTMSFAPDRHIRATIIVPAGTSLWLRGVKLRSHGLKSIFNGKDLAGWKEAPNRKSKFTVNNKGELNVKDGPGDLQTEGQWDDFILQFDCISNGKHLNSGLFFRCIPGQYQQGYEAQIRNEWKDDDRTKPVDFGTGAIYRRQAARKVVSTDGEWFTMTIVARGNRLCTWVNGYQVTDFIDERPANDNARNGSKTGKGALSIQGHDPTTDLSFRNFRIAELARGPK
jgi:3-keto-disaccharide hydrolase